MLTCVVFSLESDRFVNAGVGVVGSRASVLVVRWCAFDVVFVVVVVGIIGVVAVVINVVAVAVPSQHQSSNHRPRTAIRAHPSWLPSSLSIGNAAALFLRVVIAS